VRREPFDQYRRFLRHYTSRYAALAHIVPQRLLRLAPFGQMRDQLEAQDVQIEVLPPAAAFSEPLPSDYEAMHRGLNDAVNAVLKQEFKLLSMTSDDAPAEDGGPRSSGVTSVADMRGRECGSSTPKAIAGFASCLLTTV
jgi:hypothetical protein